MSKYPGHSFSVFLFAVLCTAFLFTPAISQKLSKRPTLQGPDYYKRILLIPPDSDPESWKFPRLAARICDTEVIFPPSNLRGDLSHPPDGQGIAAWLSQLDISNLDGVILSVETIVAGADEKEASRRLQALKLLRERKPTFQIVASAPEQSAQLSGIVFDDLVITPPRKDLMDILLARYLNLAFKRSPRIRPIVSSKPSPEVLAAIEKQIRLSGGQINNDQAELILFINVPNPDESRVQSLSDAVVNATKSGYYSAVADCSESPEPLLSRLRSSRRLDGLAAYSYAREPAVSIGKTMLQVTTRLIAAKALRDVRNGEQLERMERSQVEMLLTRYLSDWAFPVVVLPAIEQARKESGKDDISSALEKGNEELRKVADSLFDTQFKGNYHDVQLGGGGHVVMKLVLLERCTLRFESGSMSDFMIDVGVHIPIVEVIPPQRRNKP